MHAPRRISDHSVLRDEKRRLAIRSAAEGQNGVDDGGARVGGYDGHQPQALVQHVFQVRHVLDGGVVGAGVRVRAAVGVDLGLQLGPDVGPAREHPPRVGEETGGGVAAGEEDVEKFAADDVGVLGLFEELVEEDVAVWGGGFGGCFFDVGGCVVEPGDGVANDVVGELVDCLDGFGAFWVGPPA